MTHAVIREVAARLAKARADRTPIASLSDEIRSFDSGHRPTRCSGAARARPRARWRAGSSA